MPRLLVLAIYPAPYRVELINEINKHYESDVFFEDSTGDSRNEEWFTKGNYFTLDTKEGKIRFEQAKKNIRQYSLVLIYDYSTKESIKLMLRCRVTGVPYTLNADGVMLSEHGNTLNEFVKRVLVSGAKACFASGNSARKYFIKYGAKLNNIYLHTFSTLHRNDVLNNPISENKKKELREKINLPLDGKLVVAVGRFIPLKRYDELIGAWKAMPPEIHLLLIGGGGLEDKYRNSVEINGMKNVIIEPFHPKEELMLYYQASDVFVHPTSYDVWGLVVNEAMANGLPCVVSDHCVAGLELIKNGENGFLTKMGDEQELCKRVLQIIKDLDLLSKMSVNAIESIRDFTIESMAEAQIEAIRKIIE